MFVINVQPGQEVLATVTEQAKAQGVANAALVSLIGAVTARASATCPRATTGIKDGKPHIHCVLGTDGDVTLSGHLHWAKVEHHFVNVYGVVL